LLLLAAPVQAQEPEHAVGIEELKRMDIEDLMKVQVSTISRTGERLDLAPGSIYVYPRELIRQRGYRSLGELLQTVPGFTVFHKDQMYVVGIRGLNANDNDKMSLLINGQRVLGLHEQELLDGPINLDNVERVEVVVGPSSLFQQADTLAATVNLITHRTDGAEAAFAAGTALPYSATVMGGKHWGDERFVTVSATLERKAGYDAWPNPSRMFLPGRNLTGRELPSYFGVLLGQYRDWSGQLVAYRSAWPELWIDGSYPSNSGQFVEQFHSVIVRNEHRWTEGLRSVVSLEGALKGQVRSNAGGPPLNATSQSVKQRQYRAEAGLRFAGGGHRVQGGAQASFDDNYDTWFTFDDLTVMPAVHIPRTTIVDKDTYALGFYLDDELELSSQVKLVGGVRIDHNSRLAGGQWFPAWRSAVIVEPFRSLVSKLVFYRAVRMPSPFEALNKVFGTNNPDGPQKPAFANLSPTADRPEKLTTVELQNIFYAGPLRAAGTIYHQDLKDFITWFQPHSNGGNFGGWGAEVSVQASFEPLLTIWANGAWNDSRLNLYRDLFKPAMNTPENVHSYVNDDNRIVGSVRYTANLGVDAALLPNLRFSPALRYFTDQAAYEFRPSAVGGAFQETLRNRIYLDATLSWLNLKLGPSTLDLRLSVTNILDDRRPVAVQLFADVYRPRGIAALLAIDARL
jgi:outer membrane receptor protein involved in Fe transport